jgi:putative tricarboxylic transport membrane protein
MGILEGMVSGFMQATSLGVFPYLFIGASFGMIVGIIPGIGGHFAMAMIIPFLYTMEPAAGIAFLLGSHSTVSQGGGLTAILFNIPGNTSNVATLFDGAIMRNNGQGGVAVGVAMTSCFIGAAFGSMVIAMLLPVLQYIVLLLGPPEIFVLVILALTFVAVLGDGHIAKSIIAALGGLLLAMVGLDNVTNQERFTFGMIEFQDGLELVPVILGLFAISEMIDLWVKGGSLVGERVGNLSASETQRQIFQGVRLAFKHWWLVLRCSAIGTAMGLVPGLGSTAASFVAYGHAKQTSKSKETFGKGNIEGVIAPEAAIDAVEGGALASTVAFGIPGSSSMAIVLAGLFILGMETGPKMITENVDFVFVMIFTIVIGNLIGTIGGMFLVNPLTRASAVRSTILVPVLITTIVTGAYTVNFSWFDIGVSVVFGIIGYLMRELGYSRAAMLIGFVLGFSIEKNLYLAVELAGPYFILRPIPLGLTLLTLGFLGYNIVTLLADRKQQRLAAVKAGEQPVAKDEKETILQLFFVSMLGLVIVSALIEAWGYSTSSALAPLIILVPLLVLVGFQLMHYVSAARGLNIIGTVAQVAGGHNITFNKIVVFCIWIVFLLMLIFVAGHYAGIAAFMYILLKYIAKEKTLLAVTIAVGVTLFIYILFEQVLGMELYRGMIYRISAGYAY